MESLYPLIKTVHISAALASGSLFAARGVAINWTAAEWPMRRAARVLSWTIDTVLLSAAAMLMVIVRQYPGVDDWLTVKVAMVIVYIGLGYFALGRARTRATSMTLWVLALLVFAMILGVARAHDPMGWFATA